jgi:hypothetical protein
MKIDELVGYKDKPEYKVFKNPPTDIGSYADAELTAIARKLNELGYKQYNIGTGYYAQVYARPEDNYVIKIFRPDVGYSTFLKFIRDNTNNPYVPKLKGKIIKLPNNYSVVRLEKLKRIDIDLFKKIDFASNNPQDKQLIDEINQTYPGLLQFIEKLKEEVRNSQGKLGYDLHRSNMMMRGDTPVVTDPFS